ncbi:hypothetical protein WJX74_007380 [Apatococcus lobatus]|uniref:USP domain-containing protein n=1 Tax=Apatococcus lobatus TaxID=904363 RepID=A0AAW1S737_9CHLO
MPTRPRSAGCKHLQAWKARHAGHASEYEVLQTCLTEKQSSSYTGNASGNSGFRHPWLCLHCAKGCLNVEAHSRSHSELALQGHHVLLDVKRSELFCCCCHDYQYDGLFDRILLAANVLATTGPATNAPSMSLPPGPGLDRKRKLQTTDQEAATKRMCPCPAAPDGGSSLAAGLRGLNNLGQTCFMNSVLQAMLHAPLLKDQYLGGFHPRSSCQRRECLDCELDAVFSAAYSGERHPYSPAKFLWSWWQHAADQLAGHQQQDAHEFYLFMLSRLGQAVAAEPATPTCTSGNPSIHSPGVAEDLLDVEGPWLSNGCCSQPNGMHPAEAAAQPSAAMDTGQPVHATLGEAEQPGLVSETFGGELRSDVTCCACGYTSTAVDPFLDISLDIDPPSTFPPPALPIPRATPPSAHAAAGPNGKSRGRAKGQSKAGTGRGRSRGRGGRFASGRGDVHEAAAISRAGSAASPHDGMAEVTELQPLADQPLAATQHQAAWEATPEPSAGDAPDAELSMAAGGSARAASPSPNRAEDSGGAGTPAADAGLDIIQVSSPGGKIRVRMQRSPSCGPQGPSSQAGAAPCAADQHDSKAALGLAASATEGADSVDAGSTVKPAAAAGQDQEASGPRNPTSPIPSRPQPAMAASTANALSGSDPSNALTASPHQRPLSPASTGSRPTGSKGKGRGSAKQAAGRPLRCGSCFTCRNKQLKKACLRNKELRDQGLEVPTLASPFRPPLAPSRRSSDGVDPGASNAPSDSSGPHSSTPGPLSRLVHPSGKPSKPSVVPKPRAESPSSGLKPPASPPAAASDGMQGKQLPLWDGKPVFTASLEPRAPDTANLLGCLHRFTRQENLGPREQWICARCKTGQRAIKQMSIRKLPSILTLHVKRFEHRNLHGLGRKLETPLAFPVARLNMWPFLSACILRHRFKARIPCSPPDSELSRAGMDSGAPPSAALQQHGMDVKVEGASTWQPRTSQEGTLLGSWNGSSQKIDASAAAKMGPAARGKAQKGAKGSAARQLKRDASANSSPSFSRPQSPKSKGQLPAVGSMKSGLHNGLTHAGSRASSLYDLFCVICHRGSLAGGHYTAFLRCGPQWFLCDDACLMAVAVADVAACQPYMLFYSRTNRATALMQAGATYA